MEETKVETKVEINDEIIIEPKVLRPPPKKPRKKTIIKKTYADYKQKIDERFQQELLKNPNIKRPAAALIRWKHGEIIEFPIIPLVTKRRRTPEEIKADKLRLAEEKIAILEQKLKSIQSELVVE
jgi:hypothetical protein